MNRWLHNGFLFFAFFVASVSAGGQQRLSVRDGISLKPLPGATAQSGDSVWVADQNGVILLPGHPPWTLSIRYTGYARQTITVEGNSEVYLQPEVLYLESVTVNAYEEENPVKDVPGNIALVEKKDLISFGPSSLTTAFNALPGIRLEERSPGSYRLNIRGSTLRSPYGIRNVKVYLGDIPLTEPTGTTPLNLLDLPAMERMIILRGPVASLYGAGYGGALLLNNDHEEMKRWSGSVGLSSGSYGTRDLRIGLNHHDDRMDLAPSFSLNHTDGYRQQSALDRKVVDLPVALRLTEKDRLSFNVVYADMDYELPGGLTREQMEKDPRAARQEAVDQHSSVDQQYLLAGVTNEAVWKDWHNTTSVFFSNSRKDNPFITNYETDRLNTYGVRTRINKELDLGAGVLKITVGTEWQKGDIKATNYGNRNGIRDTLRYRDDNTAVSGFEYIQATYQVESWKFIVAGSLNHLSYTVYRQNANGTESRFERHFERVISPRFGVRKKLSGYLTAFANVNWGFSPPTLEEIRTSDGAVNTDLEAEKARSYEVGGHFTLAKNKLYAELSLFRMPVTQTIVSLTDEFGNSLFRNAGSTIQQGIECMANWQLYRKDQLFMTVRGSVTANDFRFKEYRAGENNDFSGNALTGSMPFSFDLGSSLQLPGDLTLHAHYSYGAAVPLDDGNTVYGDTYHLINASIERNVWTRKEVRVALSTGLNNLLDATYSLGNDLNAFGNRYYNPAPGRNYFFSLACSF